MEDREANVREVESKEEEYGQVHDLVKKLFVEEGLLENVGLGSKLALVKIITGARNRNAEFDVEVLVELALLTILLEVLVLENALGKVLELGFEVRL